MDFYANGDSGEVGEAVGWFKVGLYGIRPVRILFRSTPAVMLSPAVAKAAGVHSTSAAMATARLNITAGVASAENSNRANPI